MKQKLYLGIISLLIAVSAGCSSKIVLLPHDAAWFYNKWQESIQEGLQCEQDILDLKDTCDKLLPQVGK